MGDRTFELIGGFEPSANESTGAWLEVGVFPASGYTALFGQHEVVGRGYPLET